MPPCSSTTVCVNFIESRKACQTPPPSVAKLIATSTATVTVAAAMVLQRRARQQRDRNQHAELRLVGEAADQHAGKPRLAVEPVQRAAEQRGGEESVMAVADIDEHGREGGSDQQRLPARQDRAQRREIGGKARHQPDRETPGIGNRGDQERHREEERRIVPAIERHVAAAENRLLRRVLQRRLIGVRRPALPGQRARGIDVGKVGAERLAVAVDQPVRDRDPAGKSERAEHEQDQAVAARARRRQPVAGSQTLARNEPFCRGILGILR